jgi:hypothetical protein
MSSELGDLGISGDPLSSATSTVTSTTSSLLP